MQGGVGGVSEPGRVRPDECEMDIESLQLDEDDDASTEATPLCLHCLERVDPLDHVCANCQGAVGQLTPYLPFESIRFEASIWGRMWHQMNGRRKPVCGRMLRLFLIAGFAWPVLLVWVHPAWQRWGSPALEWTRIPDGWRWLRDKGSK